MHVVGHRSSTTITTITITTITTITITISTSASASIRAATAAHPLLRGEPREQPAARARARAAERRGDNPAQPRSFLVRPRCHPGRAVRPHESPDLKWSSCDLA